MVVARDRTLSDPLKNGAAGAYRTALASAIARPDYGLATRTGSRLRLRQALAPVRIAMWTGRLPLA